MLKNITLTALALYKKIISPLINRGYSGCRFYPSCSEYAIIAINKKGAIRGGFLAFKRVLRCNPLFEGGVDEIN